VLAGFLGCCLFGWWLSRQNVIKGVGALPLPLTPSTSIIDHGPAARTGQGPLARGQDRRRDRRFVAPVRQRPARRARVDALLAEELGPEYAVVNLASGWAVQRIRLGDGEVLSRDRPRMLVVVDHSVGGALCEADGCCIATCSGSLLQGAVIQAQASCRGPVASEAEKARMRRGARCRAR